MFTEFRVKLMKIRRWIRNSVRFFLNSSKFPHLNSSNFSESICFLNLICVLCTCFFFTLIPFVSSNNHFYFTSVLFTLSQHYTHIHGHEWKKQKHNEQRNPFAILVQMPYSAKQNDTDFRMPNAHPTPKHTDTPTQRDRYTNVWRRNIQKRKIKRCKCCAWEKPRKMLSDEQRWIECGIEVLSVCVSVLFHLVFP